MFVCMLPDSWETILENGGFGEEFLVRMIKMLLEKATYEAFGAFHEKGAI